MLNEENEQWPFVDHPSVTIEIQDEIFCFEISAEKEVKRCTYSDKILVNLVKFGELFHDCICDT